LRPGNSSAVLPPRRAFIPFPRFRSRCHWRPPKGDRWSGCVSRSRPLRVFCMGRGPGANRVRHERPESYLRYRSSDSLPLIAERQSLSLFPAAASTLRVRPASPRFNRSTAFAVTGCRLSPIEWFSPPMAEASSVRAAFAAGPVRRSARLGVNHGSQSNFPPAVGHFCLSTASASPGLAFTCP
jgi:hypothetical protein